MSEHLSLIEFIRKLLCDTDLQHAFKENPEKALASVGLADVHAHDVKDALTLVHEDSAEPEHHHGDHKDDDGGHDNHAPEPHHHESAAEYVNRYIHNTFEKNTLVDNSFHQKVDTDGGDFDQELDFHPVSATGDGAVAAGDDIRDSTITTGDHNQVGDGNIKGDGNVVGDGNSAVTGDHNTTGFGSGDVSSTSAGGDINVGDGAAFSSGGDASVDNSDNSQDHSNNSWVDSSTNDSNNDSSDNSINDSGNTDIDASTNDSGNVDLHAKVEDSFNDNSDNSQDIDLTV
jgi:hypothetical protein